MDAMYPKVSVVLVCYNRGQFLTNTLDSILGQTFKNFELIVSDDCSTDDTPQVALAYSKKDQRIRYRRNERNLGMPGNLIAGMLEASGEYIANLHDGDIYHPQLLEKWSKALDAHPNAAFVFNAYGCLDAEGNTERIFRENLPECFPGSILLEQIYFKRWNFSSAVFGTVMARKKAYENVGTFDRRFGFYSDVDMWLRMAENFEVCYVPEPLISLPSKKVMPNLFDNKVGKALQASERMFLDARLRHWRDKPVRLICELLRHYSFLLTHRSWQMALALRRTLRRNSIARHLIP